MKALLFIISVIALMLVAYGCTGKVEPTAPAGNVQASAPSVPPAQDTQADTASPSDADVNLNQSTDAANPSDLPVPTAP